MLKQTANNEWEIIPTPFPKELKDKSYTVLNLARIGFVYQGFDGNFHSFIHRYTKDEQIPNLNNHYFEELLVYGTGQSILIGYVNSYYNGLCTYCRFAYNKIKSGAGYILFEAQIDDLAQTDQTEQDEYNFLDKPNNMCTAYRYFTSKQYIKEKFDRIRQFLSLANLEDFGFSKGKQDCLYKKVKAICNLENNYTPQFVQKKFSIGYSRAVAMLDEIKKELESPKQ